MSLIGQIAKTVLNLASLQAGAVIGAQTTLRAANYQQPRPMPHQFAGLLEHPLRLRYRHPADLLGELGIAAGMTVLDLGCGSGLYTVEMARMVGAGGVVHALDIQPALVEQTRQRLLSAALADRVQFHCSGAYALPLPAHCVDLAVLVATLGEIPDKEAALSELRRVLKPNGILGVSEELLDPGYLPAGAVMRRLESNGFRFGGRHGSFFCYNLLYYNQ
ncbi:MAG: methyltransferase domain-containing protein [Caldilineaceae bacterium]